MTASEYFTYQFYSWEFRGRGWYVSDSPVCLEPPFIPFFRHGFQEEYVDDGKRHTFISKAIELVKGKKPVITNDIPVLEYEDITPFEDTNASALRALQIQFPKERKITPERMKAILLMLSSCEHVISFEIIGNAKEIVLQFVSSETDSYIIETYIKAYFPEASTLYTSVYLDHIVQEYGYVAIVDFGLKEEFFRPLYIAKNFNIDPLTGILGVLERFQGEEQGGVQVLFQGAVNAWRDSIVRSVTLFDGNSFFNDDALAPKRALEKVQSSLFGVAIRVFGQACEKSEALAVSDQIGTALLHSSESGANQLIPLGNQEYTFEMRLHDLRLRKSHRLGMLLNVDELSTFLHFPADAIVSKKLFLGIRKTRAVPLIAQNKQYILGENYHQGVSQSVSLGVEERVKHTHVIGATGTGKSTLIANLILQDVEHGNGLVLFDPHGDLVDDVIGLIPEERISDVILIDPSDTEFPIGLNVLQAHTDIEREILSSDLVATFKKYATSWGDQMSAVLGNAIQAILENPHGGTLTDLRRFLIEKEYRQLFLEKVTDPTVLYYWQKEFPLLKTNSIGPILTRLDGFLRPRSIRNMVIQNKGIDFENALNTNKIILCKLAQGLIGMENSFVLGSLLLSKIHQALFRRQQLTNRKPIFLYLDEFQNFITPSIKELLSGIRKYNVGLTLSHQDLQQLHREDAELLNSVLGNTNNRIVFRVGEPDAKNLQDGFGHFEYPDLQNLSTGEAIIRIEQPQFDCSLTTLPIPQVNASQRSTQLESVRTSSRHKYASTKQEVEQLLYAMLSGTIPKNTQTLVNAPVVANVPGDKVPSDKVVHIEENTLQEFPSEFPELKLNSKKISAHRYLQSLIKQMAESKGYIAIIEMQIPHSQDHVDLVLTKEGKRIGVEICNTTDPEWEMHNIMKCIDANFDLVVSLCEDKVQLEKIRKKCRAGIAEFEKKHVEFFTPDAFFSFLDTYIVAPVPKEETIMKGYRVNVTYDAVTREEMNRKRASVAKVVLSTMKKHNQK
ncbi:type IV secretory system conjugative DNA transfer family protein [Limnovirga soli]|uniref:Type IV secretion system DNA-binding domain-containing protein n=1 Tax=Limnovirga soli TaxID=2656915 RepID=A0A8J8FCJ1_9BACT|nr:type IV secretion system DNA-binding domain-containing protein [Limnovirga soli]NNV53864.1 type IV secretion system DNA-binding domain-containing protein [Limnovirga soli]